MAIAMALAGYTAPRPTSCAAPWATSASAAQLQAALDRAA